MTARLSSLRLRSLAKTAAEAPTLPTSLDRLDPATAERLEAFAARERLTVTAALAVVRDAQKAARTELRAEARVEAAVATVLDRRRRGLVGLDSPASPATDGAVAEILARRAAERSAARG